MAETDSSSLLVILSLMASLLPISESQNDFLGQKLECDTCNPKMSVTCAREKCLAPVCFSQLTHLFDINATSLAGTSSSNTQRFENGCIDNRLFTMNNSIPEFRRCQYGMKTQKCVYRSVCRDDNWCNYKNVLEHREVYPEREKIQCHCQGPICSNDTCTGNTCFMVKTGLQIQRGCSTSTIEALLTVTQLQSRALADDKGREGRQGLGRKHFRSFVCRTPFCNTHIPEEKQKTLGTCTIGVGVTYGIGEIKEVTPLGQCLGHYCSSYTRKVLNGNAMVDVQKSHSGCVSLSEELEGDMFPAEERGCYKEETHNIKWTLCLNTLLSDVQRMQAKMGAAEKNFDSASILIIVVAMLLLAVSFLIIHLFVVRQKRQRKKEKEEETETKKPQPAVVQRERQSLLSPDEVRCPSFDHRDD